MRTHWNLFLYVKELRENFNRERTHAGSMETPLYTLSVKDVKRTHNKFLISHPISKY